MLARLGVLAIVATCTFGCRQLLGFDEPSQATGDAAGDSPTSGDGPDAPAGWLDPFTHRKPITIPKDQVSADTLVDFPVLIATVDAELAATALVDGRDIVFTAADGTTLLALEIEAYAGGTLVAWVKVPLLSPAADTKLYMYYGNPTPPISDPTAVWTASYQAVFHLDENPGPGGVDGMRDSTTNAHHGTASPGLEPADSMLGQIGNAIRLDGTNMEFVSVPAMDVGNAFTISMWMRLNTIASGSRTLLSNSNSGVNTNGFRLFVNSSSTADGRVLLETGNGNAGDAASTNVNMITLAAFQNIAVTVNRTAGTARIFIDGIAVSQDETIRNDFDTNADVEIGRMGGFAFLGDIDEVVFASTIRPPGWIGTAFANQQSPSTFATFGAEESR